MAGDDGASAGLNIGAEAPNTPAGIKRVRIDRTAKLLNNVL